MTSTILLTAAYLMIVAHQPQVLHDVRTSKAKFPRVMSDALSRGIDLKTAMRRILSLETKATMYDRLILAGLGRNLPFH